MAFIDYYKILGVSKDIPQKDIRAAYRKRSKQFHPDLHPDDPKAKAKFQMLNEAYDVLNDPDKRAKYDQYGENWKQADRFGSAGGGNPFGDFGRGGGNPFENIHFNMNGGNGGFSDFFSELFGGMGGGRARSSRSSSRRAEPSETECSATINVWTAMLGGDVIAETPYGKFKLKIAAGTQSGKKVRLKGKGGTKSDGTLKDLIIVFNVQIPTNLSEHQKDLLRQAMNG